MKRVQVQFNATLEMPDDEALPSQEEVDVLATEVLNDDPGCVMAQMTFTMEGVGSVTGTARRSVSPLEVVPD